MNKLLAGVATVGLATFLPYAALAADMPVEEVVQETVEESRFYISLHGGWKFGEDWDDHIDLGSFGICAHCYYGKELSLEVEADANAETDDGWRVGGAIGWQVFEWLALEGELSYMKQDFENVHLESADLQFTSEGAPVGGPIHLECDPILGAACTQELDGDVSIITAMVNALVGIPIGGRIRPYLGVGAGAAHVSLNDVGLGGALSSICCLDDSETTFAVQGMAGVDIGLTQHLAVGVRGRVLHVGDVELEDDAGFKHDIEPDLIKSLEAVLTIGF